MSVNPRLIIMIRETLWIYNFMLNKKASQNSLKLGLQQRKKRLVAYAKRRNALKCTVNVFLRESYAHLNAFAMDVIIKKITKT